MTFNEMYELVEGYKSRPFYRDSWKSYGDQFKLNELKLLEEGLITSYPVDDFDKLLSKLPGFHNKTYIKSSSHITSIECLFNIDLFNKLEFERVLQLCGYFVSDSDKSFKE